jgi:cysteine sulfinate desulfinase/cysteine desulfurase-like protein
MNAIYLDCSATTPLDPAVIDAITSMLREGFGKPNWLNR